LFGLYKRFDTQTEGRGLGLYLVKAEVEALNGLIEVKSELDKGTTFKITLPSKNSKNALKEMDEVNIVNS
jgi:signal transduction histidine kinase